MIAIIGAGLSGLSAAQELHKAGIDFTLFEKDSRVGGRVKSDYEDGFIFDHGFQVLLTSYPELKSKVDLSELSLKAFSPGAKIYLGDQKLTTITNPLQKPFAAFETLSSPIGSLFDKLKIISLLAKGPSENLTTLDFLKNHGFSKKMIESFFKPFFSGVFLESELKTNAQYFHFLYKNFSQGHTTLPSKGMQALSDNIAKDFIHKIRLNSSVQEVSQDENTVSLRVNGEVQSFSRVIVAVEAPQAKKMMPELSFSTPKRSVSTYYFKAPKISRETYLYLNASRKGQVNHIAFLSSVQESYAPKGQDLISVNILSEEKKNEQEVLKEIGQWKIFSVQDWSFLKAYHIAYALPDRFLQGKNDLSLGRIAFAGDFIDTPSINGALLSGRKSAQKLISHM